MCELGLEHANELSSVTVTVLVTVPTVPPNDEAFSFLFTVIGKKRRICPPRKAKPTGQVPTVDLSDTFHHRLVIFVISNGITSSLLLQTDGETNKARKGLHAQHEGCMQKKKSGGRGRGDFWEGEEALSIGFAS